MAQRHTTALQLALPLEIWRIVLHSFGQRPHDLVDLWIGCRGVSRFFKYEVEEFFIANYLPHVFLLFDMTTCQCFNGNSKMEFYDHKVETEYSHISVDRAGAFFRPKHEKGAKLLQRMHNRGSYSAPSHLVDLGRPSHSVALPGIFFHANGNVEVAWRELFAAVLAEERYYYQTGWKTEALHTQSLLCGVVTNVPERGGSASAFYQLLRKAEMYENNMSKAEETEASRPRVFHMNISWIWDCTETSVNFIS